MLEKLHHIIGKLGIALLFLGLYFLPIFSHAGGLALAPLAFIIGIAGLLYLLTDKPLHMPPRWVWPLIALLIWCAITTRWTLYDPGKAFYNVLILLIMVPAICAAPVIFKQAARTHILHFRHLFMATSFAGIGVLVIDLLSGYGLNMLVDPLREGQDIVLRHADAELNIGHGITVMAVLLAPLLVLMWTKLKYGKVLAVLTVAGLMWAGHLCRLNVAHFSVMAALLAMGAAYTASRLTVTMLFALALGLILGAPLIGYLSGLASDAFLSELPLSWEHRVRMWGYSWERIAEAPFFGHGFDAVRTYTDTFTARDGREIVIVSLHPHNAGLQIWNETGLIGAGLASTTLFYAYKPAMRFIESRPRAIALAGLFASMIVISSISYGVWQYWWWGVLFLSLGVLQFVPKQVDRSEETYEL